MSESAFDGQILSDKLSKVDSSQKSIESTSKWCITHRKKARQIVEAWDKLFKSAQKEQRVAFLFLSNDILQNSRRKGSEFVNEFWKVLPTTLKSVYESGDESGKKAASRLVNIWEERKVFGSRGQNLKNDLMSIKPISSSPPPPPPPSSASNGKSPNPIKIVKRDSLSLRIKLAVGCMPEKIVTGFHSVLDENVNEEAALNKCKDAVNRVGEIEKNVEIMSAQGNVQGSGLVGDIQEAEKILKQCATQLESAEATRSALVSQLKEALQDQESELEFIRSRLKVVHRNTEQATNIKEMLASSTTQSPPLASYRPPPSEPPRASDPNQTPQSQAMMSSFSGSKASEDESKKAAAAAMAAKLTASTSSVEMLSSVLSSFVAKEAAASLSSGLQPPGYSTIFSPEKRQKLEKPMAVPPSDNQNYQPPHSNSPTNHQFSQSTGHMMGMQYGYSAGNLPPPPPLPSHVSLGLTRPTALQPPPSPQQQQQQQSGGSGYYRPPGIGFYGQSQQTPPPVPRQ